MSETEQKSKNQGDIVINYDIEEDSIYHPTKEATLCFGVPQKIENVQDYLIRYGVIQPNSAKEFLNLFRKIRQGEPYAECLVHARTARGELVWLHMALTTIYNDSGKSVRAVGILRDVTEWHDLVLMADNEELHRDVMMREALIYYEANLTKGKMCFGHETFLSLIDTPYTDDYETILKLLTNTVVYPKEREEIVKTFCQKHLLECYARGETCVEAVYRRLTGEDGVIWVNCRAFLTECELSKDVMINFYVSNINEQKLRAQSSRERVERDALTGLYNKVTTELCIRDALEQDQETAQRGAFFLLQVNNLREGNKNNYCVDALLSKLGQAFGNICQGEIIGRYGKNEFIAYIKDVNCEEEANQLGKKFCETGKACLKESNASIGVGIALFPQHGDILITLQRRAISVLAEARKHEEPTHVYQKSVRRSAKKRFRSVCLNREYVNYEHVIERILTMFYDTSDVETAIHEVLETIIDYFGFQRGYIYNVELDGTAKCEFDCHLSGVLPISEEFHILKRDHVEECRRIFADREVYIETWDCGEKKSEKRIPPHVLFCFGGTKNLLGFIGFVHRNMDNTIMERQKNALQKVVRFLRIFLAGKAENKELCESSLLLENIVDGMQTCTYIIDPETHIIKYSNQNTREIFPGACPGKCCYEVLQNRIAPCDNCPIDRMLREGMQTERTELYMERFQVWARVNASLVTLPSGQIYGVFHSFDFAEQSHEKDQEHDLSGFTYDTSLYDALSVSTDDYIIMCDIATKRFYFPKKMVEEFELPSQVIVDAVPIWAQRVHEDDRADFLIDIEAMFGGKTDTHNQEYRVKNKHGEWVWMKAKGHIERSKEGIPTLFAVVLTNLGKKSKVDHLTGLLDKYEFEVSIRAQLTEEISRGVMLLLGLDNFRYINNIYGWEFGDTVLKEASLRLLSTLPDHIQLYRLDGDKFGVFFPDASVAEAEKYYQSIYLVFRKNRQFGEHRYYCTISGGCSSFEGEPLSFGVLYKQAAYALDTSKREGKNRLTIYDEKTMSGNERQLSLMSALHESVEQDFKGFELYFQPQINPNTKQVKSAEALLRWNSEEFGRVSPVEFIPLLEQTGLIHRIGRWVLNCAMDVCRRFRERVPDFSISVNVSFYQLQDQMFMPYLTKLVEDGRITPGMIHLEITESCIVDGSRFLGEAIKTLRAAGFLIEMDDFGTGYSSLEVLKNAPADVVKIDRTFVRDITHSKFDETFIRIIVELCHSAGIHVCLEGVETAEELKLVQPMNLDLIQGFYFGRPQPEKEFEKNFFFDEIK